MRESRAQERERMGHMSLWKGWEIVGYPPTWPLAEPYRRQSIGTIICPLCNSLHLREREREKKKALFWQAMEAERTFNDMSLLTHKNPLIILQWLTNKPSQNLPISLFLPPFILFVFNLFCSWDGEIWVFFSINLLFVLGDHLNYCLFGDYEVFFFLKWNVGFCLNLVCFKKCFQKVHFFSFSMKIQTHEWIWKSNRF